MIDDTNPALPITLAGIDIGTNTFRLLVADVRMESGRFLLNEIESERVITRLGEGLSDVGLLREDVMDRAIETLRDFRERVYRHNVSSLSAVGTSALREAGNSDVFIKRARDEAGIDIRVISEDEEARLTARGMMMDIEVTDSAILLDIGGGSTEFVFVKDGRIRDIRSLKLGVVSLAERYMRNDPPTRDEIRGMEDEVIEVLDGVKETKGLLSADSLLIGTAGTITTISAISQGIDVYSNERIHKSKVAYDFVERLWNEIKEMRMEERVKAYPIIRDGRGDIIVPGTLALKRIMMLFGFKEIIVSDNGLREGIIIELYREIKEREMQDC